MPKLISNEITDIEGNIYYMDELRKIMLIDKNLSPIQCFNTFTVKFVLKDKMRHDVVLRNVEFYKLLWFNPLQLSCIGGMF